MTKPDLLRATVIEERILRERQVIEVTGMSHATIRRRVVAGTFPAPVKLGDGRHQAASGWLASEVVEWMRALRREETTAQTPVRTTPRSKSRGMARGAGGHSKLELEMAAGAAAVKRKMQDGAGDNHEATSPLTTLK